MLYRKVRKIKAMLEIMISQQRDQEMTELQEMK